MKLYHGTNYDRWPLIQKNGLQPRSVHRRRSNWKHTIESNPQTIYLSNGYAQYFAFAATKQKKGKGLIIEIETDRLDPLLFAADEDAME
jgi:hypothetical protein